MNEDRILCNWNINPDYVTKILKVKRVPKNCQEDWLVIKKFDFGELGFDYEEGLRFETTTDKIGALINWIQSFHRKYGIPTKKGKYYLFTCSYSYGGADETQFEKFPALTKQEYNWALTKL